MLSNIVNNKLKENLEWCYPETISDQGDFIVSDNDRDLFVNNLDIRNKNSAFIDFYSIVAIPAIGCGDELNTLEIIMDIQDEVSDEIKRFLPLSSIEGEGCYYFDKVTDQVFDVDWGDEDKLINQTLKPSFESFSDFLDWYYSE